MWMNFVQDATAKIEGLTSGKSRFLQAADYAKFAADAAAELCGIAHGRKTVQRFQDR